MSRKLLLSIIFLGILILFVSGCGVPIRTIRATPPADGRTFGYRKNCLGRYLR